MHKRYEIEHRGTEFHLKDGSVLRGPKQALGSLYKEFVLQGIVYRFYLHQANNEAFVYKMLGTRHKEIWDRNLPTLLHLV